MQDNLRYFLTAAEELSITKAAKKLFISQQCLSEHIQKLEKHYNTKLFYRSPRLSLTPSGEAMVRALNRIQIIENSLMEEINENSLLQCGAINLGIIQTRATLLLPHIIPKFYSRYPNIKIIPTYGKTTDLEPLLLAGKLDFFLGINLEQSKGLEYLLLEDEQIYLVVSDNLLKQLNISPLQKSEFDISGVDLKLFKNIPFVLNSKRETLRNIFDMMTQSYSDQISVPVEIDDPQTRAMLCMQDFCVTVFAESMLPYVRLVNLSQSHLGHLNTYQVKHSSQYHYWSVLAYHKNTYFSDYRKFFVDTILDYYR